MSSQRTLRTVKSLPALRTLAESSGVSNNSTNHSLRSLFTKQSSQTRQIHVSTKKDIIGVISKPLSDFAVMNVNSLRVECRKRGLPIWGRKADIISRLQAYEMNQRTINALPQSHHSNLESKKLFSTSKAAKAKGDDSSIDYFKFPTSVASSTPPGEQVKVPKLFSQPTEQAEPTLGTEEPTIVVATDVNVRVASHQGDVAAQRTQASQQESQKEESKQEEGETPSELSKRDKTILSSMAAAVAAWWIFNP